MTEKIFPADTDALEDVLGFIETELEKADCPVKNITMISVAIEEVFVNVAHYAYPDGTGDVKIEFDFDENERTVMLRISDKGIPFDPLNKPDPDITLSAQQRQIGGLGIFITKKTMDNVSYRYENGENILTMTKKI